MISSSEEPPACLAHGLLSSHTHRNNCVPPAGSLVLSSKESEGLASGTLFFLRGPFGSVMSDGRWYECSSTVDIMPRPMRPGESRRNCCWLSVSAVLLADLLLPTMAFLLPSRPICRPELLLRQQRTPTSEPDTRRVPGEELEAEAAAFGWPLLLSRRELLESMMVV